LCLSPFKKVRKEAVKLEDFITIVLMKCDLDKPYFLNLDTGKDLTSRSKLGPLTEEINLT
jgi:hypothetical protein